MAAPHGVLRYSIVAIALSMILVWASNIESAVAAPADTSSAAESCGLSYLTARTTDPNVRMVQISSYVALPAVSLALRLDTATTAYTYALPALAIDHAVVGPGYSRKFVSLPMQLSLPATATISDAVLDASSATPTPCDATRTPAATKEAAGTSSAAIDAATAIKPTVAALEAPACKEPFKSSGVVGRPAQPAYPLAAQSSRITGVSTILVTLAAAGTVVKAAVLTSSGSKVLDDSALDAASRTTYTSDVIRCTSAPGHYEFSAYFGP